MSLLHPSRAADTAERDELPATLRTTNAILREQRDDLQRMAAALEALLAIAAKAQEGER